MVQKLLANISFISPIFYQVLYMTVIGSVVGLTVYFIRNIFDKKISGKWKCIMWGMVILTFLIPIRFQIQTEYQIMPNKIIDKVEDIKYISNYEYLKKEEIAKEILVMDNQNSQENNDMPIITNDINLQTQWSMSFKDIMTNIVIPYIWLGGVVAFIIIFLSGVRTINKKIPRKSYKNERIEIILNSCKSQLHINKKVRVILQEYKRVPSIFGMISPKILITNQTLQEDDETIKYIFLHELSHYKRKDILFNYILLCVVSIHWFNPIVWFLFNKIRQDIEVGADELATRTLNLDEKKEYGMVLINLLRRQVKENYASSLLCMSDTGKNMERRISMMKGKNKNAILSTIIGLIAIGIIIGVVFVKVQNIEDNMNIGNSNLNDTVQDNNGLINEIANNVEVEDSERIAIEEYINKICNWNLCNRLPEFSNINAADKVWIYAHLKAQDDPYYLSKKQIEEQLKNLFGKDLIIDVDKDIKENNDVAMISKDEIYVEKDKYALPIFGMDYSIYYTIDKVIKQNGQYIVEVVEFIRSYDMTNDEEGKESIISTYNENITEPWKWEKVFKINTSELIPTTDKFFPSITLSKEVIKRKEQFQTFNITIIKNEDGLYNVVKVEKN